MHIGECVCTVSILIALIDEILLYMQIFLDIRKKILIQ
ncbi:MAG: hypothetical protein PWP16_346 [Eubacteriaceae bacterium]|jgi:hypothetical protein|nr:hypothetical protein [Eubacteriaceae bacterium]MDK2904798.1 hypothetical protein [Eubacteriaceae bacterium]MDK2935410.1 hypothetical protein [Eubacteriaceae bacterium]MDK2961402.1 hypothetical protein [Eubacteriaceae bacterium]MDN5306983.1 hypothetical protein [Eubacteriaceae bacterium]